MKLELDDSRRLTGKGMLWDHPGAVIDAFVEGVDKQKVVDIWQKYARFGLKLMEWEHEKTTYRIFEDGVTVALSAPFDALYAACEINEKAWDLTCGELNGQIDAVTRWADPLMVEVFSPIAEQIQSEINPPLIELIEKAKMLGVPWLTDDDEFSLGFGASTDVWDITDQDNFPSVEDIDWSKYSRIPVALVTGTNGKSTSVRLASEIFKQAGKRCGVTSTDFIRVGDEIIDKGDYSGPGGARTLLRHPEVEVALLEVARGGILRRGLPVPEVDCALITNVAEDHLGQYGINTLEALTAAKFVVAKGVTDDGLLVLNADDEGVVRYAEGVNKPKCWFSINEHNPVLQQHASKGGVVCFVRNGQLVFQDAEGDSDIVAVNDVPMTFNGAATHNILNALGAIGLGKALKVSNKDIGLALANFRSDADDNPGRGNVFEVKGATVVMDFAHNEHSMSAIVSTTNNMPSQRTWLMMSAGGDRSDEDIQVMTGAGLKMNPDRVVSYELKEYLRGRAEGSIPAIMKEMSLAHGLKDEAILTAESPFEAAKLILQQLQPGDLALMLVLSERDEIVQLIKQQM